MSQGSPLAEAQLAQVASVWIEQIDGCTYWEANHQWVQDDPDPQEIVIHAKAVNFTKQPIPWASIGAFWPNENLNFRYSGEVIALKTGQSLEATFQLAPLQDGQNSALYLFLFENNAPALKKDPIAVPGVNQALTIHTTGLWKALRTKL